MTSTGTDRPIAPIDLAAERAELGDALDRAVREVLESGQFVLGRAVERFEERFAAAHGVPHGIGVASGTDALVLGLRALGVGPGDHVLTSPFTFFASAGAIAWIGAVPRFADVDPATGLLDVEQVRAAIDERTRCLVPVHLYGQLCDVRALRAIADERGVPMLEDGAQAHGARRDGAYCGSLGELGAFSFYPTKNLGAAGEGGLLVCRDDELAAALRRLRDHGSPSKYVHVEIGTNSRLAAIQAAILDVKLARLEDWNERRRAVAARYDAAFAAREDLVPMRTEPGSHPVYHQYGMRVLGEGRRDELLEGLRERGILAAVHYPLPVHLQPAAAGWGYRPGDLPGAEALAREVLCLPVHPFLAEGEVERVVEACLAL